MIWEVVIMNSNFINNLLSFKYIYLLIGIMIILFILIWLCKWKFFKALNYLGTITIISSIVFLFVGVLFNKVIVLFGATYVKLFKGMVDIISRQIVINSLISLGIGILILILSRIIGNKIYYIENEKFVDANLDNTFVKEIK